MKPLKVGALAARTGISVRTLHHYDEIDLLSPSARTDAGHRLYTYENIMRLQQIQSLRSTGLSLESIASLLNGQSFSAHHVIELHLDRLQQQLDMQQQLVRRLKVLKHQLRCAQDVDIDELCRIIESTTVMDTYFTAEQLQYMETRGELLGAARAGEIASAWAAIIPAIRHHMAQHTPLNDPSLVALAVRWRDLVNEFTGGDKRIAKNARTMFIAEHKMPATQSLDLPDSAMFEFMGSVFDGIGGGPG